MTVDVRPKSTGETLAEISARLYKVEQRSAAPGAGAPQNPNPAVNTITVNGIVVGTAASPATGLSLASAAFMEDIWIDASWAAPVDGTAANYDIELARKVGSNYELVQNYRVGTATSIRMAALEPSQTYGVRVTAINRIGVRSVPLPSSGFMDITTGLDATIPSQTAGVQITAGIKTVMVTWNEVVDRDVARGTGTYEVQLDTVNTFTAPNAKFTSATITSFQGILSNTTYFARVRAIDNSGNSGAWSSTVSTTTVLAATGDIGTGAVTTTNIADLAVINAKIANLAVDDAKIANLSADKITVGTLNADRIAANTLDVNKLTASTLTSKTITIGAGGVLKIGNAPTTGIFINDQGIRLYSGGVAKVVLDVAGTASFEGNISASTITSSTLTSATINSGTITGVTITGATVRTAASGKRVQLQAGIIDALELFSGNGSEATPGRVEVGSGVNIMEVDVVSPRANLDHARVRLQGETDPAAAAFASIQTMTHTGTVLQALEMFTSTGDVWIKGSEINQIIFNVNGGTTPASQFVFIRNATGGVPKALFRLHSPAGHAASIRAEDGGGTQIYVGNLDGSANAPISATAFNVVSREETKEDIEYLSPKDHAEKLLKIKPVRYKVKGIDSLPQLGLVVEDVVQLFPEVVNYREDGSVSGIDLMALVTTLIQQIQVMLKDNKVPGGS